MYLPLVIADQSTRLELIANQPAPLRHGAVDEPQRRQVTAQLVAGALEITVSCTEGVRYGQLWVGVRVRVRVGFGFGFRFGFGFGCRFGFGFGLLRVYIELRVRDGEGVSVIHGV